MGVTVDGTKQQRRGNTRQRIQDVALELFAEQGYEKTSLREIAEHLGVTKAALYYHFKTKEEILVSISEDLSRPVADLIEWGRRQPHTLETKQEIVRRYSETLAGATPLLRFMQENQATVRELRVGEIFKERMRGLREIIIDPEADPVDQIRCVSAILTLHAGTFFLQELDSDPDVQRAAVLEVATELVTRAHQGPRAAPEADPASDDPALRR